MTRLATVTRRALAGAVAAIAAAGCGGGAAGSGGAQHGAASTSSGTARSGEPAQDFSARDIDGKTVKLSDYLGKQAILIHFWATWCEPCLAEMPHLHTLFEKHKAKGFIVLAVSIDGPETVASVASYAKRNAMKFPVLLDEDSRIVSLYNPKKSAPLNVLVDKAGKVVYVHEGFNPGDEIEVEGAVTKVLDQAAPPQ